MNVKKLYFDMDGVLADFDRGISELCGLRPFSQDRRTKAEDDFMWEKVRAVDRFYAKLEPLPDALEMFRIIYSQFGDRCEILTGIPKKRRGITTAGEDKEGWVRKWLSEDIVVNIVYREQKKEYCGGLDCVLIDDLRKNISEWEAMGGTGIWHKEPKETLAALSGKGILIPKAEG